VDETKLYSLVFAGEATTALVRAASPGPLICVTRRTELVAVAATRGPAVAFVDLELLPQLGGGMTDLFVVGIVDDTRGGAIRALVAHPWVPHLITTSMLSGPDARAHIEALLERLESGPANHVLGPGLGRAALLGSSSRREARFERMREFFAAQGISARTISAINDIAEELVTNALYDAPVEAGYFKAAVQRTEEVELPPEHACEISYGIEQESVFVRVRDPFGALTRARLLNVLNRCTAAGVSLDESRGGAGLGLWRIFSTASTIAITVIPGALTDIHVRIEARKRRSLGKQLLAVHLFFPEEHEADGAHGRFAADHDHDLMDESFTALCVA
jgi:hypothetical protein